MDSGIDPSDVEQAKQAGGTIAALTAEHYEQLRNSGFSEEYAFVLTENYHWALISSAKGDD